MKLSEGKLELLQCALNALEHGDGGYQKNKNRKYTWTTGTERKDKVQNLCNEMSLRSEFGVF